MHSLTICIGSYTQLYTHTRTLPIVHSCMSKLKAHTCSGISLHGWINSIPSDTHSDTHTKAHIHVCACVDHLLTMLCNNSTCLGLRLLFPSKKLTMSGWYTETPGCCFFSLFFLSPVFAFFSRGLGLESCIIQPDQE